MTPKEIALLRALRCVDVQTFLPADNSPERLREFDDLVETLCTLERCGWIELKLMKRERGRSGRHQPKYAGAAARCTDQGREALRLLGEAWQDMPWKVRHVGAHELEFRTNLHGQTRFANPALPHFHPQGTF